MAEIDSDLLEQGASEPATAMRHVQVEVESTSKPERADAGRTYKCDALIRISEGEKQQLQQVKLSVRHPRGWMGVRAGFEYEVDSRLLPTFAARAEYACLETLKEFPSDQIISVLLLGSGEND